MGQGEVQTEVPAPQRRAPARKTRVAATPEPGSADGGSRLEPHAVRPRAADALNRQLQRAVANRDAARPPLDPLPGRPRFPLLTAGLAPRGSVQRTFSHKGKKQKAVTFGKDDTMPTIQGTSKADLAKLAGDDHDYGQLEDKTQVAEAMTEYARRHPVVAEKTPLEESQVGNVTVLDVPAFRRNIRATFQLDWLQGKHDQPFMRANNPAKPRGADGTQMRRNLEQYRALARGVPTTLAGQRLTEVLAKPEEVGLDFSVMLTTQSDGLNYEISAKWQDLGGGKKHLLVYYHCFPPEKDEAKWR